ncbi:MAG: ATP-binding protein [Elainellaceae cyanobacterium]
MQYLLENQTKKQILVVDDKPDNLRLLSAMLAHHHYDVRKALSSSRVIESVKADAPDLILLDIRMPEIDGYEVCTILKKDPKTRDIPIIFLSALDDILDKVNAFAVGGSDYITKPFQEAEVLARIENQLKIRELQCQLKIQNEELVRSNRELEQFAHIVSHDLQQPLQTIMGYTQLVALQEPEPADSSTHDCLKKILHAGDRMQRLIKDLLSYALTGQDQKELTLVDCNVVLEHVVENLDSALNESQAELSYPQLPVILGNEIQLALLFQNLVSNAIKFVRSEVTPQITITVSQENRNWLFAVKDNGIGIPSEQVKEVFRGFHRLHSAQKYPGHGIGLATCKRIVENHGGTIWAESQPNIGTTVYFKLPLQTASVPASLSKASS